MVVLQKRRRIDEYLGEIQSEQDVLTRKRPAINLSQRGNQKRKRGNGLGGTSKYGRKKIQEVSIPSIRIEEETDAEQGLGFGRKGIRKLLRGKLGKRVESKREPQGIVKRNITFAQEDEEETGQYEFGEQQTPNLEINATKTPWGESDAPIRQNNNKKNKKFINLELEVEEDCENGSDRDPSPEFVVPQPESLQINNNSRLKFKPLLMLQVDEKEELDLVLPTKKKSKKPKMKAMTLDLSESQKWRQRVPPAPRSQRMGGFELGPLPRSTREKKIPQLRNNDSEDEKEEPAFFQEHRMFESPQNESQNHPPSISKRKKIKFSADLVHLENDSETAFPIVGSSWQGAGKNVNQKAPNAPRNNKKVSFNFGAEFVGQNAGGFFGLRGRGRKKGLEVVISEGNSEEEIEEEIAEERPRLEIDDFSNRIGLELDLDAENGNENGKEESYEEVGLELPVFRRPAKSRKVNIEIQEEAEDRSDSEEGGDPSKYKKKRTIGLTLDHVEREGPIRLNLENRPAGSNFETSRSLSRSQSSNSNSGPSRNKVFLVDDFEDSSQNQNKDSELQRNLCSPRNAFVQRSSNQHTANSSSNQSSQKHNHGSGRSKNGKRKAAPKGMLEIDVEEGDGEGRTEMSSNSPRHCSQMEISEDSKPSHGSSNGRGGRSKRKIRIDETENGEIVNSPGKQSNFGIVNDNGFGKLFIRTDVGLDTG